MRRLWKWSGMLLVVAGLASLAPGQARGQARGWYLNAGLGANHLDVASSVRTEPDVGIRFVVGGGFQFNPNFGLELDTGLIHNTYSKSTRASQRDNPLKQVPVVLSGVFSYTRWSRVEPFVGVGAGLAYMSFGKSRGGDALMSFKAGTRYLVNQRVGVGADYTFFMLGATSALVEEPVGMDTFNFTLHWMF